MQGSNEISEVKRTNQTYVALMCPNKLLFWPSASSAFHRSWSVCVQVDM
jgi:hypothetical protein